MPHPGFPHIPFLRAAALALAAAASTLILPPAAFALPVVDPGFDPGYGAGERVYAAAFQVLGGGWERKTVIGGAFTWVAGQHRTGLARFHEDGSLDETFVGETHGTVWDLEVLGDNKIVVAGSFATVNGVALPGIARLHVDGSLDTSFQARVDGTVLAVARQNDGKLVVGGIFSQAGGRPAGNVARFLPNGALDTTFQTGYGADSWITAVEVDYAGRILLGGNFGGFNGQPRSRLVRLLANGAIDPSFTGGADGLVKTLAVGLSNRVLVGGSFAHLSGRPAANVGRLNADGSFDLGWSGGTDGTVESIAVDVFGQLLIGGSFSSFRGQPHANLVRVNADESIDGLALLDADGAVFRVASPNWGDLVAGDFRTLGGLERNRIARLADSFPVDSGFDPPTDRYGRVNTTIHRPYGSFLVGGSFAMLGADGQPAARGLARLSSGGRVDPYFRPDPNAEVGALLDLPDGSVLAGGEFTTIGGGNRAALARVLPNGAVDPAFPQSGVPVVAFARQADGKVLVAASQRSPTRSRLRRLLPNGAADPSFLFPQGEVHGTLQSVAVQPDGRILVAASLPVYLGSAWRHLFRLLPDGSFDPTFDADFDNEVWVVAVLPDGRILAGGTFDRVDGQTRPKIARLEPNGALDPTFATRIGAGYGFVYSLTPLIDGRVLATGALYSGYPMCFACHFLPDGTLDPRGMQDFLAHDFTGALVLADGSAVFGNSYAGNYSGEIHQVAARVLSPQPAEQVLSLDLGAVHWRRVGPLPELTQVRFELSTDGGATWQSLGQPTRVEDGWRLDGLFLPPYVKIRATGSLATGRYNGSSTLVTEVLTIADPNLPPEE